MWENCLQSPFPHLCQSVLHVIAYMLLYYTRQVVMNAYSVLHVHVDTST